MEWLIYGTQSNNRSIIQSILFQLVTIASHSSSKKKAKFIGAQQNQSILGDWHDRPAANVQSLRFSSFSFLYGFVAYANSRSYHWFQLVILACLQPKLAWHHDRLVISFLTEFCATKINHVEEKEAEWHSCLVSFSSKFDGTICGVRVEHLKWNITVSLSTTTTKKWAKNSRNFRSNLE